MPAAAGRARSRCAWEFPTHDVATRVAAGEELTADHVRLEGTRPGEP